MRTSTVNALSVSVGTDQRSADPEGAEDGRPAKTSVSLSCGAAWNQPPCVPPGIWKMVWPGFV